jgi:hypothetical protein
MMSSVKDNKTEMITIRVTPEEMRLILEWGSADGDLPSKPEVVRRMIEWAAQHRKRR